MTTDRPCREAMSTRDYHSDFSSVSRSMLNTFMDSRQEYYYTYISREMSPKAPTAPMLLGTILHAMLLEDKTFDDLVVPYDQECLNKIGGLIGSRAAEFRETFPDQISMKPDECEEVQLAVEAIMRNPALAELLSVAGEREQRVDEKVAGLDCKCKPDIWTDIDRHLVCYDLKFSKAVDPRSFRRSAKRLRYWLQDAHYSAVLSAANGGAPVQFRFCVVEVQFPFRVRWYWFDPVSRQEAAQEHRRQLGSLAECHKTGDWSDNWDDVVSLDPWDVNPDEPMEVER